MLKFKFLTTILMSIFFFNQVNIEKIHTVIKPWKIKTTATYS